MAYTAKLDDKRPNFVRCHNCYAMVPVKDYLAHTKKPCKKGQGDLNGNR